MSNTQSLDEIRARMREAWLADEGEALAALVEMAGLGGADRAAISARAADLVRRVRGSSDPGLMEEFLAEYGLSTREGVALMCLAEALLRVPDAETIDELIQDKLAPHDWGAHLGQSSSSLVNASTWALMLTGRVLDEEDEASVVGALRGVVRRLGEPVVRVATARAMREMGAQFVLGRDINEAIARGAPLVEKGYSYSYDMLGEAARTEDDAQRYHGAYAHAIAANAARARSDDIRANPGISVKLSALHPRYEFGQAETMLAEMSARLIQLARAARDAHMGLNIDAEESDRLDLSLEVVAAALAEPSLAGWDGLGVVVQAYGPRASHAIDWLYEAARVYDRRLMVRLVKGAYWDTEIKRAQTLGLAGFPVFSRKVNTDVSYIACASKLLAMTDRVYPQFATHNAHTIAAVLHMGGEGARDRFEFQRLHGMGEALHEMVRVGEGTRTRIYAPVGAHRDLLAYLVRRLLENGANSSFVHQIVDEEVAPEEIARDPFVAVAGQPPANPAIAAPSAIYGASRKNAKGWDIADPPTIAAIEGARARFAAPHRWRAWPITPASGPLLGPRDIVNPADPDDVVGEVAEAGPELAEAAIGVALSAQADWAETAVEARAGVLSRAADLYEAHAEEFFALAAREAGKTLLDGVAELREAVDFLRYYALEAERVELGTRPRGPFVCVSPWNFPLAIFTGQIAAALGAGNAVIAKPAEQTPLIAARAVSLLHEAGVPRDALQLLPGDGPGLGAALTGDPRIAGVCFTGSTATAQAINRALARGAGPGAALIAETGGLNAMIVDSTALPEQAVRDILASAFQSAGQRCSALRILYVQRDVEARMLEMLFGAMDALKVGDPWALSSDVGPVIDEEARAAIAAYCEGLEARGRLLKRVDAPSHGRFIAPQAFRVTGIEEMEREIFGPVLHIARFDAERIEEVVDAVNRAGYGLTFGLHTRIDARVQRMVDRVAAGNTYVNRNQIGAIVGSQPFGGEGLSGTGPKAGGPHYLRRFRRELDAPTPAAAPAPMLGADALERALQGLDAAPWAGRADRLSVMRRALRGRAGEALAAAAALDPGPIDLPGPTGESNRLRLAPRGRALCLGLDAETALGHAVQALALGGSALMIAPGAGEAAAALAEAGAPIAGLEGRLAPEALTSAAVDAVAACGSDADLRAYAEALAARDGPILPLIAEARAPAAFAHERAICVDTTAAGGNAALLAKAG